MTSTDWIKPGAEVLVYRQGGTDGRTIVKLTKVGKVAKLSFTVEGIDERFKLETGATSDQGSTWHRYRFKVTRPDSDIAKELTAKERSRKLLLRAHFAVEKWERDRTRDNRLAAIDALQNVED